MKISEIKCIFELLMKVNCTSYVLVSELADEMGMKKTDLMRYIDANPDLFTTVKKGEGLAIEQVFESAEQKPYTDAWVKSKKKEWKSRIHVRYITNTRFGPPTTDIYIEVDTNEDGHRYAEWRNTPEKIESLIQTGLIKQANCYPTSEEVHAIKEAGYTLVFTLD